MVGVWKSRTGHPVMMIVEIVATAHTLVIKGTGKNMENVGCIWGFEIMK